MRSTHLVTAVTLMIVAVDDARSFRTVVKNLQKSSEWKNHFGHQPEEYLDLFPTLKRSPYMGIMNPHLPKPAIMNPHLPKSAIMNPHLRKPAIMNPYPKQRFPGNSNLNATPIVSNNMNMKPTISSSETQISDMSEVAGNNGGDSNSNLIDQSTDFKVSETNSKDRTKASIFQILSSKSKYNTTSPARIVPRLYYQCPLKTKGQKETKVEIFADPYKCNRFYYCLLGEAFVFQCPRHLYYNPLIKACDFLYLPCFSRFF